MLTSLINDIDVNRYTPFIEKSSSKLYKIDGQVVKVQAIPTGFQAHPNRLSEVLALNQSDAKRFRTFSEYVFLEKNNYFFEGEAIATISKFSKGNPLSSQPLPNSKLYIKVLVLKILKLFDRLHKTQTLHGDVSLDNIWIKKRFIFEDVGLTDFNIFSSKDEIFSAPEYKAPEVNTSVDYDLASEIWSLGIVVYFLFYKDFPFPTRKDGLSVHEVRDIISNQAPDMTNSSRICNNKLLSSMLHPDPTERIVDMNELQNFLTL